MELNIVNSKIMAKKTLIYILFLFLFPAVSNAQNKALNVGDNLPDITFTNLINSPVSSISLQHLNHKIIILDFGGTTCTGCVIALPGLNALQQKFNDHLQIFWVTNDPPDRLRRFIANNKIGKSVEIPMLAQDTLLTKYFPHAETPYEVWIDQDGTVKAFSDPELVDEAHVEALINNTAIDWPTDIEINFDNKKNLITWNPNLQLKSFPSSAYYAAFSNHLSGFESGGGTKKDTTLGSITYQFINQSILGLYRQQFYMLSVLESPNNRFEASYKTDPVYYQLLVKDSSRVLDKTNTYNKVWEQQHTYCYEASFPVIMPETQVRRKIIADLDFYLGLKASVKEKELKCWVLKVTSTDNHFEKVVPPVSYSEADMAAFRYKNEQSNIISSIEELEGALNRIAGRTPFLDDTGLKDESKLGIEIKKSDITNLDLLRKALAKYGLDVQVEMRKVKMFVLTDAN